MTNTELHKLPRRGPYQITATTTPGLFQVSNLETGTRSRPLPYIRALRILVKATRTR